MNLPVSADDWVPGPVVAAARAGSPEALRQLYERFGRSLFQAAYRVTANRADAEDVIQDVFLGLPRALAHYEESGRLGGWLATLATRCALMRLRRGRREASLPAYQDLGPPAKGVTAAQRTEALDLINRIPAPLRQVFVLKEVEGYRHDEIAGLLGISVGASEVRLHRAWKAIERLREGG